MDFPLDPEQRQAVYCEGHALVSACPGSGKTRVLSCKAAHILDDSRGRLVAVTFTRDAASELRQRIIGLCKTPPRKRLLTGTFHSLALNQIFRSGRRVRILGAGEQYALYRRAWDAVVTEMNSLELPGGGSFQLEDAIAGVEAIKSRMGEAPPANTPVGVFYKAYQDSLIAMGAYDFADIMIHSVQLMRSGDLKPLACDYMLVDEAQDMDEVQYAWIECHANNGSAVTVVGDDDKSIYGWRNAMGYEGLMRFKKQFQATHVTLYTNYRSAPEIINVASSLVSRNKHRVEKAIRPHKDIIGRIEVVKAPNRNEEAVRLALTFKREGPRGWAVLARTNRLLGAVELELRRQDIPFKRIGGKSFWDTEEPSVFLGVLRSLISGDGVGELMALHWAGIDKDLLDTVKNGSTRWDDIVKHINALPDTKIDKVGQKVISTFVRLRQDWSKALRLGRYRLVISGLAAWCRAQDRARKDGPPYFDWCEEAFNGFSGTLEQRLIRLTQDPAGDSDQEPDDVVQLMTIHNSKGLEFPSVWLVAAEENILPHVDSTLDEERRLCYVAMTRAQERLVVSFTSAESLPSRFLAEAGLHLGF